MATALGCRRHVSFGACVAMPGRARSAAMAACKHLGKVPSVRASSALRHTPVTSTLACRSLCQPRPVPASWAGGFGSRSFAASEHYGRRAELYDDDVFEPADDAAFQQRLHRQQLVDTAVSRSQALGAAGATGTRPPAGAENSATLTSSADDSATLTSSADDSATVISRAENSAPVTSTAENSAAVTSRVESSAAVEFAPSAVAAAAAGAGVAAAVGAVAGDVASRIAASAGPVTSQSGLASAVPSQISYAAAELPSSPSCGMARSSSLADGSFPSARPEGLDRAESLGVDAGHKVQRNFDAGAPNVDGIGAARDLSNAGSGLRPLDWKQESLVDFRKSFYQEHPDVARLSQESCHEFLNSHDAVVEGGGSSAPKPLTRFEHAGFSEPVLSRLQASGFAAPTPIQALGWPIALSGHDMIGLAQTGSGKTLAYLLPAFVHIAAQPPLQPGEGPVALVLVPTRELAMQIQMEAMRFGEAMGIVEACVFGGVSRRGQEKDLRRGAELVIATPGRLLDFLQGGVTNLKRVTYLVLDEADRMLDMGFEPQLRRICTQVRPDRQTLMWSATWPREVQHLARDFCKEDPMKLTVGRAQETRANPNVSQQVVLTSELDKKGRFLEWIQEASPVEGEQPRILVFTETKRGADGLCQVLRTNQFPAAAIHGDKEQRERDRILHEFRTGKTSILVATDVAQRGLDIKDVRFVVNYDVPKTIEDYVHRIGRTARAGAQGTAVTFFGFDYPSSDKVRMAKGISKAMQDVGQTPPDALLKLCEY